MGFFFSVGCQRYNTHQSIVFLSFFCMPLFSLVWVFLFFFLFHSAASPPVYVLTNLTFMPSQVQPMVIVTLQFGW